MPTLNSGPQVPTSSTAGMSHLVQLFLGGSLAAVALLIGLLIWKMAELPHASKPAAEQPKLVRTQAVSPRQTVFVIEPPKEHAMLDRQVPVSISEPDAKAPVEEPSHRPEPLTADQIFEQRLQASEDELRRELGDVPELRLLADEDVRNFREREKIARVHSRENAKAAFSSVPRQVQNVPMDRRIRKIVEAEERVMRAAATAEAKRMRVAASVAADQQVVAEFNQSLQQSMRQAANRAGLTLHTGPRCELAENVAASVAELSQDLRRLGFVANLGRASGFRFDSSNEAALVERNNVEGPATNKVRAFQKWCDQHKVERFSGAVPTLTQMLQIEGEPTRLLFVRELARIHGAASTVELADRAVMDLSPEVRSAAVAALSERPSQQYVPVLTRALRYPWPAAADHAAVALRALKPLEAAAPMVGFLDLPSPSSPVLDPRTHQYSVRELVRLNHLRNCLLCHAVSTNKEDGLVRGLVPTPGIPLRGSNGGGGSYYSGEGDTVRADITYLRQDFSVVLLDKDAAPWPPQQRYDFVTRLRTVPPDVATDLSSSLSNYPQRDAVLYALRGMTGKDGGDSSAKWREMLGIARDNSTVRQELGASVGRPSESK